MYGTNVDRRDHGPLSGLPCTACCSRFARVICCAVFTLPRLLLTTIFAPLGFSLVLVDTLLLACTRSC